jgi:hypothetical protein
MAMVTAAARAVALSVFLLMKVSSDRELRIAQTLVGLAKTSCREVPRLKNQAYLRKMCAFEL